LTVFEGRSLTGSDGCKNRPVELKPRVVVVVVVIVVVVVVAVVVVLATAAAAASYFCGECYPVNPMLKEVHLSTGLAEAECLVVCIYTS